MQILGKESRQAKYWVWKGLSGEGHDSAGKGGTGIYGEG